MTDRIYAVAALALSSMATAIATNSWAAGVAVAFGLFAIFYALQAVGRPESRQ